MIIVKHPKTILIRNEFYPSGLTEEDVISYYNNIKQQLLSQVKFRELIFFIATDLNKSIIKRKLPNGSFIRLTKLNYDDLIHGRVISIHSTMNKTEDFCIIDIDTDNFKLAKQATLDVYDYLKDNISTKDISILFTGKSSFHIIKYNYSRQEPMKSKYLIKQSLLKEFQDKYLIGEIRSSNKVNLDLSSNKYKGGFITKYSLSVIGLKCMEVSRNDLPKFEKHMAVIK